MKKNALLSDLQSTTKYEAGDRVVVRCSAGLSRDQSNSIYRSIQSYCRAAVRVMFVDLRYCRITLDRVDGRCDVVAGSEHLSLVQNGKLSVGCGKIQIDPGDLVTVVNRVRPDIAARDQLEAILRDWVGNANEVLVLWGQDF